MGWYWIDGDEGLKMLYELLDKRVVNVEVKKYEFGVDICIEFEGGYVLYLDMTGYPEEWEIKIGK